LRGRKGDTFAVGPVRHSLAMLLNTAVQTTTPPNPVSQLKFKKKLLIQITFSAKQDGK